MKTFILALICLVCFGTFANADNGRRQPIRVQTYRSHDYGHYRQDFRFQRIVIGDYSQQYVAPEYAPVVVPTQQEYVVPTQRVVVPTQQYTTPVERVEVEVPVQRVVIQRVYTQPVVVQRVYGHSYGYTQGIRVQRIRGY